VGIGKIIIRQAQHLAGVKVVGDALVLEIMRFANELVPPDELSFPDAELVRPQELRMAEQLVANLEQPFEPEKYTDEYRANLMRVIRAKMKGKNITPKEEDEEPGDAKVLDLMARLQASLGQGRAGGKRAGKGGAATEAPTRAAAKKGARAAGKKAAAKSAPRKKSA
jgi:DNA end-binding protein Ku